VNEGGTRVWSAGTFNLLTNFIQEWRNGFCKLKKRVTSSDKNSLNQNRNLQPGVRLKYQRVLYIIFSTVIYDKICNETDITCLLTTHQGVIEFNFLCFEVREHKNIGNPCFIASGPDLLTIIYILDTNLSQAELMIFLEIVLLMKTEK